MCFLFVEPGKQKGKKLTKGKKDLAKVAKKALLKEKLSKMTKEQKEKYKKGKRDADSDSDFSYRSFVSDGGTRHVKRRRKRDDGTYSDEHSYHSSQDEDGEARRRQRRRDREHGSDSEHSYYSFVSEGGTRHVRRRKRHEDGTYSRSESYRSNMSDGDRRRSKSKGSDDSNSADSDVSVYSVVSEGGTRTVMQKKRIRDENGNVIGYGDPEPAKQELSKARREAKDALDSLQQKRDGQVLRESTMDSLHNLRDDGENIISSNAEWPGSEAAEQEQAIIEKLEEEGKVPSDFSDATTEDDIDLSKLTPAQRRQYLAEKERRRKEREKRRREKYGDKYDDIMKKKNAKKYEELAKKLAEKEGSEDIKQEKEKDTLGLKDLKSSRRRSSNASSLRGGGGGRPKSMVTYDKGPPRDLTKDGKKDNREIGMSHEEWGPRERRGRKGSDASEGSDLPPKLHRETTMLKTLPTIPQGKVYEDEAPVKKKKRWSSSDDSGGEDVTKTVDEKDAEDSTLKKKDSKWNMFEVGKDGRIRLNGKKIDLSQLTHDDLRKLGIDPFLSAKEIAKKLKAIFGQDIQITQGDRVIGTKGLSDFDRDVSDDTLARDPNLDVDSLTGIRRVNVIMQRGGAALQKHLEKVINLSKLVDKYAKDLDERDADIDFLSHYRLVEQSKIDTYARAFVVEDNDLDTVINCHEARVALDGVPSVQHMTNKQMEYVMKVLKIDEATLVTFRMFAVVTALCERVTHMDSLSQKLLEICNLADIERKLDLYKSMFYTNTQSDRNANFITSDSLKIELIAGGLNWKQQQYIMEKMEPNDFGEISFLDYMCYIPLFLSMHDNICYNPLDMSNQKYQQPPRERPASVQRDMNPLGSNLTKQSAYWSRKKAMDIMQAPPNAAVQVSKSYMDILNRYKKDKFSRLKKFEDQRLASMTKKENTSSSMNSMSNDMIY